MVKRQKADIKSSAFCLLRLGERIGSVPNFGGLRQDALECYRSVNWVSRLVERWVKAFMPSASKPFCAMRARS